MTKAPTPIFILICSLVPPPLKVGVAIANEIKQDHSPVVIVVLDPKYNSSYKVVYTYSRSIA